MVEQINLRKNMEFNKRHKIEWGNHSFFVQNFGNFRDGAKNFQVVDNSKMGRFGKIF